MTYDLLSFLFTSHESIHWWLYVCGVGANTLETEKENRDKSKLTNDAVLMINEGKAVAAMSEHLIWLFKAICPRHLTHFSRNFFEKKTTYEVTEFCRNSTSTFLWTLVIWSHDCNNFSSTFSILLFDTFAANFSWISKQHCLSWLQNNSKCNKASWIID